PDAFLLEALDVVVVRRIRALHRVAEIVHDLGDARHADAADTDEMNGTKLRRQFHGIFPLFFEGTNWRTARARRSAASVILALFAAAAASVKRSGRSRKPRISTARRSGVNSLCGRTM